MTRRGVPVARLRAECPLSAQDEHFEVRAGHRPPWSTGVQRHRPELAKALTEYPDVFRLAIRPKPLRPIVYFAFRVLALAAR